MASRADCTFGLLTRDAVAKRQQHAKWAQATSRYGELWFDDSQRLFGRTQLPPPRFTTGYPVGVSLRTSASLASIEYSADEDQVIDDERTAGRALLHWRIWCGGTMITGTSASSALAGYRFPREVIALGRALVSALRPVLPRYRGAAGRAWNHGRSRHRAGRSAGQSSCVQRTFSGQLWLPGVPECVQAGAVMSGAGLNAMIVEDSSVPLQHSGGSRTDAPAIRVDPRAAEPVVAAHHSRPSAPPPVWTSGRRPPVEMIDARDDHTPSSGRIRAWYATAGPQSAGWCDRTARVCRSGSDGRWSGGVVHDGGGSAMFLPVHHRRVSNVASTGRHG